MEEIVKIPREEYEKMIQELTRLRNLQEIDFDVERQVEEGLADLRKGRIIRLA
jgi:stage III sporulation protein SpoIIIAA